MNILFFGDIFGEPGRKVIRRCLPGLKEEFSADLCIANGENLASGKGLTEKTAREMFNAGIHLMTGGNHLWDRRESTPYLERERRIARPANYPRKAVGFPVVWFEPAGGVPVAVVSMVGQVYMPPANSPFETFEDMLPELQQKTPVICVDFHAEASAEKRVFGTVFDGRISAMFGTHTHIQTADEEILPGGTAYITDVGMTGPHDSIIGIRKDIILQRTLTGMPVMNEVAETGLQVNAVFVEIGDDGRALRIERIRRMVQS